MLTKDSQPATVWISACSLINCTDYMCMFDTDIVMFTFIVWFEGVTSILQF